jgi:uncharacterized protein
MEGIEANGRVAGTLDGAGARPANQEAVSTSLAVVLFVAIVGAAGYIATGFGEELLSLPPLIVGSMLGAWPGVRLRELAPQRVIRYGFAIYMVLAAMLTLVDVIS